MEKTFEELRNETLEALQEFHKAYPDERMTGMIDLCGETPTRAEEMVNETKKYDYAEYSRRFRMNQQRRAMGLKPIKAIESAEYAKVLKDGPLIPTPEGITAREERYYWRKKVVDRICERLRKKIKSDYFKAYGENCIATVDWIMRQNKKIVYTFELYCNREYRDEWLKREVELIPNTYYEYDS